MVHLSCRRHNTVVLLVDELVMFVLDWMTWRQGKDWGCQNRIRLDCMAWRCGSNDKTIWHVYQGNEKGHTGVGYVDLKKR